MQSVAVQAPACSQRSCAGLLCVHQCELVASPAKLHGTRAAQISDGVKGKAGKVPGMLPLQSSYRCCFSGGISTLCASRVCQSGKTTHIRKIEPPAATIYYHESVRRGCCRRNWSAIVLVAEALSACRRAFALRCRASRSRCEQLHTFRICAVASPIVQLSAWCVRAESPHCCLFIHI